ncbi:MAG: GNAT family N-acetyltransferase, partial [Nanoarchaeota archaeon]
RYDASNGSEIFISYEDLKNDLILGFIRLRIPNKILRKEITDKTAIIREVHVYSPSLSLGTRNNDSAQHRGLGQKLVKEAERIAKEEFDMNKMLIISGIGARQYFINKLNYKKEGPYVSKFLS